MSWAGGASAKTELILFKTCCPWMTRTGRPLQRFGERQARRRQLAGGLALKGPLLWRKNYERIGLTVVHCRALRRDGPSLLSEAMRLSASGTGVDAVWRRD